MESEQSSTSETVIFGMFRCRHVTQILIYGFKHFAEGRAVFEALLLD